MKTPIKAYVGAKIHDGIELHINHALVIYDGGDCNVVSMDDVPKGCVSEAFSSGIIFPGFVDLQVNGGGGIMFNDEQSVDALRTIAAAHAAKGTVALLPTLITDTVDRTRAAIDAVEQAVHEKVPGIVGLHLEGPHLSIARKGAHDPQLIRQMKEDDVVVLLDAAERLPNLMVTVAPENTTPDQIRTLAEAGIIVSLGHTNASFDTCMEAFDAGASCATHLFNAMSQLGSREPGLVGATLARKDVYAGLIADGIHVHPSSIRIALAAKSEPHRIFLVTDAMATTGSDIDGFALNGREVFRKDHRLTLVDGTLAGADLEMARAISVMVGDVDDDLCHAIARATSTPASLLKNYNGLGRLTSTMGGILFSKDEFGSEVRRLEGVWFST